MTDRILIVEDDVSVRESLLSLLESKDYVVESASDGEQALEAVEQRDYDVLLLDLQLPKVSGMEVLANAKKLSPDTSIVILTAHGSIQSAVEALKLGAEDYLEKPCDVEQLQKMLEKIFARKLFLRGNRKGQNVDRALRISSGNRHQCSASMSLLRLLRRAIPTY